MPLAHYNLLSIERAIRNACRGHRSGFDCNAVMRPLIAHRLIDQKTKLTA